MRQDGFYESLISHPEALSEFFLSSATSSFFYQSGSSASVLCAVFAPISARNNANTEKGVGQNLPELVRAKLDS